jgi:predicted AlkP superfamily phosphohydrolase/phosphomutase
MRNVIKVLALVLAVGFAAACASQKVPAETALKAAETAWAAVSAEATKYMPTEAKGIGDAIAAAKGELAKGNYEAVIKDAGAIPARIADLRKSLEQKKGEWTSAWKTLESTLGSGLTAVQAKVEELTKARKLPAGVEKTAVEGATTALATAQQKFGQWAVSYEGYGQGRIQDLLALRREMLDNTRRSAELAEWLLTRPWSLAIICFAAPHRGGHRLWDRSSIKGPVPEAEGAEFDGALRDIYIACDTAIGRLVAAHPKAAVVVFSTHGMMVNTSRVDFLDEMLARVLAGGEGGERPVSLARRVGEALPEAWRRALTKAIPAQFRNRLVTLWSAGAIDWARTPAFCCRADLHGYIRINLKGREPLGIVEPGREFDALCDRIAAGLATFRDADTGEPIVEAVCRADQVFPDGPYRDRLPDLIVQWRPTPATSNVAVRSPTLGVIRRTTPGRVPNGRSGNHRGEGFLIARGPGIPQGQMLAGRPHIRDLAPTVLARLGVTCAVPLSGTPIKELASAP